MIFAMSQWRLLLKTAAIVVAVSASAVAPGRARASVSLPVPWERLLQESTQAVIATPIDARAAWEGGRIYTYSRVHIDRAITGVLPTGGEAWVRTMGGVVRDIGQQVEGEAELVPGQSSLLFLQPAPNGAFHVTARAQGQFPVIPATSQQPAHVVRSRAVGGLVALSVRPPAGLPILASETLHGLSVDDAVRAVLSAWNRTHPVPTP